jgi:hypothetical protein
MDYVFYSPPLQNTRQQLNTVKNIIIPWFKQADRDDDMGGTLLLCSLSAPIAIKEAAGFLLFIDI